MAIDDALGLAGWNAGAEAFSGLLTTWGFVAAGVDGTVGGSDAVNGSGTAGAGVSLVGVAEEGAGTAVVGLVGKGAAVAGVITGDATVDVDGGVVADAGAGVPPLGVPGPCAARAACICTPHKLANYPPAPTPLTFISFAAMASFIRLICSCSDAVDDEDAIIFDDEDDATTPVPFVGVACPLVDGGAPLADGGAPVFGACTIGIPVIGPPVIVNGSATGPVPGLGDSRCS